MWSYNRKIAIYLTSNFQLVPQDFRTVCFFNINFLEKVPIILTQSKFRNFLIF